MYCYDVRNRVLHVSREVVPAYVGGLIAVTDHLAGAKSFQPVDTGEVFLWPGRPPYAPLIWLPGPRRNLPGRYEARLSSSVLSNR